MELDFCDALSEDWISQPRSSSSFSVRNSNSLRRNLTSVTSASISRIPRPQPQRGSSISSISQNQVLSEKSASDLNASKPEQPTKPKSFLQPPRTRSTSAASRSLSSRTHGTVQHKREPGNEKVQDQKTPEWKRRLLEGKGAPAQHQDLFSPIGLENVFRPPTLKSGKPGNRKALKRNKSTSPRSEHFPSSPPPYPALTRALHSRASSDPPLQSLLENDDSPPAKYNASQGADKTGATEEGKPNAALKNGAQEACRQNAPPRQTKSRVQSGRSEVRYEAFSPAQIDDAQILNVDSKTSIDQLSTKLNLLGIEDRTRPYSRSSDSGLDYRLTIPSNDDCANEDADADCTSISLPKNFSIDSRAFAANGGFVTTRRGGYSSDSFFRQRPLSPSSYPGGSTPAQKDSSYQEVPQAREVPVPQTPTKLGDGAQASPGRLRSSGSPLKLFDNYDTFTNDRLARRISQFERESEYTAVRRESSDEAPVDSPSPRKPSRKQDLWKAQVRNRRVSSFGLGDLDDFSFTHRQSSRGQSMLAPRETEDEEKSPDLPHLTNELDAPSNLRSPLEKALGTTYKLKAHYEQLLPSKDTKDTTRAIEVGKNQGKQNHEGKRSLNSPEKIPNAKRRRTINEDLASPHIQAEEKPQVSRTSSIAGKKRKDAKYEHSSQQADPDTIATRHMLRPKTPQANQIRSSSQSYLTRGLPQEVEEEHVNLNVNTATGILAGQLAHMALDVAKDMTNGGRKASVTTADFFKEANMIMQHIRAQARPQNGLVRHGPLNSDQLPDIEESGLDDLTKEEFSRPSSREGPPRRSPGPRTLDARVVSHLRKFEESDDLGFALNSSVKSLAIRSGSRATEPALPHESDSYIRILNQPNDKHDKEGQKSYEQHDSISSNEERLLSNRSGVSDTSTNRSIPTGSSRGSTNRAVIVPEKVSHLIGENMGRMTFDHGKQCWVKRRASKSTNDSNPNQLGSEATEEDLLQEIPDLDVDESQELRHANATAYPRSTSNSTVPTIPHGQAEEDSDVRSEDGVHDLPKANVRDSESSAISRFTHFASSGPRIETRATSWGEESSKAQLQSGEDLIRQRHTSQGQGPGLRHNGSRKQQARAFTVTFSSPLINPQVRKSSKTWSNGDHADSDATDNLSDLEQHNNQPSRSLSETGPLPYHWIDRKNSTNSQVYSGRPVSRIDEDDEISFVHQEAASLPDMGLAVTTPKALRSVSDHLSMPPPTAGTSSVGFHLSPLPDFTVHQVDESLNLDVDYVAKRRGLLSAQEVEGKFSLAIRDLVTKITDVEPNEPYWEYIRRLDLHDRGLLTLHMLDDFCGRIEELDVSNNELGQLNGAPGSLRVLSVRQNYLSSLTAWGHLHNLQYLDVSGNQIGSLKGFRDLVHLRELRAESNAIESLEGIMSLDGLIKLKVGRNRIKRLSFEGSEL